MPLPAHPPAALAGAGQPSAVQRLDDPAAADAAATEAPAPEGSEGPDYEQIAAEVMRRIRRQLRIDRERERGLA